MVFCHECENEWYRDEHGLTCPDCRSDFTEVVSDDGAHALVNIDLEPTSADTFSHPD